MCVAIPTEFCIAASRLLTPLKPQILAVPGVLSHDRVRAAAGVAEELSWASKSPLVFCLPPLRNSSANKEDRESSKQCPGWDPLREPFAQVCLWVLHFGVVISASAKGGKEKHPLLDPDPCSVCRYCQREFMLFHSFLSLVLSVLLLSPYPSSVLCYFLQVVWG